MLVFGPKLSNDEPREIMFMDEGITSPELNPIDYGVFSFEDEFLHPDLEKNDKRPKRFSLFKNDR